MDATLSIFLGGTLLVLVLLALFRKAPFRLLARIWDLVSAPIKPVLRLIGLGGRSKAHASYVGPSAWAAVTRLGRILTETEKALLRQGHLTKKHESLEQRGFFFSWLQIKPGYIQITEDMGDEVIGQYLDQANGFFQMTVPVKADPQALYEDIEGSITVDMFGKSDGRFYYLLNSFRKIINANIFRLTVLFSGILFAVLLLNVAIDGSPYPFARAFFDASGGAEAEISLFFGLMTATAAEVDAAVYGLMTCLGGAFAMWLLFFIEYIPHQRNNSRELNNFVTRYLARVNDHYNRTVANARSVTLGAERDAGRTAQLAQQWHKIILWMAFRAFHMEAFIRSVIFQIKRNSGYYLLFVPVLFTVVILFAIALFGSIYPEANVWGQIFGQSLVFWIGFVFLIALYAYFLSHGMIAIEEVNQDEWIGYDNLQVEEVVGEVVGKYAEEVGYWKNRVGGI